MRRNLIVPTPLTKEETLNLRDKHIGKSTQLFFRENPLKIVKARAQYMHDEKGEAYLDCINNVAHVGHSNPRVVEAGHEQMKLVNTNSRFLHDNIVLCGQRLVNTMPEELSVCFFVNSGSEANDLAIRLCQLHTGNKDVIALKGAYHGNLTSLIDISDYKLNLPGGPAKPEHVHLALCPDSYRGKYRTPEYKQEELGKLYSDNVKDICEEVRKKGKGICAFIAESILSCGGQIIPPEGYLKGVYKHVRAAGGLCIADEVQTGFGRVGKHWWAFELQGVIPDIVTMGKPMGNGHPIAAVVCRPEIAETFAKTGVGYFNTFGGNPVSCAIANTVFDIINEDKLREHAVEVGDYLLEACMKLWKKQPKIGDVRGVGLMVGLEVVKDRESRLPDHDAANFCLERMKDEHVLICLDGEDKNVIKIKPPMVFTKDNVDEVIDTLDRVMNELKEADLPRPSKETDIKSI